MITGAILNKAPCPQSASIMMMMMMSDDDQEPCVSAPPDDITSLSSECPESERYIAHLINPMSYVKHEKCTDSKFTVLFRLF